MSKDGLLRKLLLITFGVFLMSLGTHFFFSPSSFAPGGVTGLAIVINHVFPFITVGWALLVGNIVLFVIGVIFLGRTFGLLTLYGTVTYSLFSIVLENILPMQEPVSPDMLISLVLGCALMAVGLAIVFMQNATTGGTDIISKILNTYFHIDLSKGFLIADGTVVILCMFTISLESSLYALISVFLQSFFLEQMIAGAARRMVLTITTSKMEEVNRYINQEMMRGTTIYQAMGGFSGSPQMVIVTVVHRAEYIRIKDFVDRIDPMAFMYVSFSSEVLGEGFTRAKRLPHPVD